MRRGTARERYRRLHHLVERLHVVIELDAVFEERHRRPEHLEGPDPVTSVREGFLDRHALLLEHGDQPLDALDGVGQAGGDEAHGRGLSVDGLLACQGDGALHIHAVFADVLHPGAADLALVQGLRDVQQAHGVLAVNVGEDHVVNAAAVVDVELAQDALAVLPVAPAADQGDRRFTIGRHLHQACVRIAHREHVNL